MFTTCKDTHRILLKKQTLLILLLIIIFSFQSVVAQETKKEKKAIKREKKEKKKLKKINQEYVEILPQDKILIGFHGGGIDDRFVLRDNKNENYYHLASSIVPSVGLHFKYKNFPTLSFSLPINTFAKNSPFITKGFSMGLHFQPTRLIIMDMYLFQINGLKLAEVGALKLEKDSTYHGSSSFNMTMELFIVFNNAKFSYKNAYLSGEIQKKSSGSFVFGLSYSFFNQKNKEIFFNPNFRLNKSLNYKQIWGSSISSMFGYLHTFVLFKKWYIGGGFLYGPNLHFGYSQYNGVQKDHVYVNVSSSFKAKFALGYNSKHVLFKIIGHTGFYGYKPYKENAFNNYLTDFRVSFTYIL